MLRLSIAATFSLLGIALPIAHGPKRGNEARPLLAPNALGTWRLDSLLDQAEITGIAAGSIDPGSYLLEDLRFDGGIAGIVPLTSSFGKASVAAGEGGASLKVTGQVGAFLLTVPKTKRADVGAIAYRVRSSDCGEVALIRDDATLQMIKQAVGGPGGPGGPGAPGGPPPAAGGPGVAPPQGLQPPAGAPLPRSLQLPPGFLAQFGGQGGGVNGDPKQLLSGEISKLATDGEWHTLMRSARTPNANAGGMFSGFMGGQQPPSSDSIEELGFVVFVPEERKESGVTVDLEFVHLLDSKADYAAATVAPLTLPRKLVLHSGLHLNTPAAVTWRLVAPEGGKLIAGLGALNDEPFELFVHVTSKKGRETVFTHSYSAPLDADGTQPFDQEAITPIAVDLAPFAGQEIALEIEVVEATEPNVAFLFQPLIYGPRPEGVRNVMLYFCDTLRADALSCYGNDRPTTPQLDALAANGIRFERCFSQGAWTYVSMPSSLTSLVPSVSGVRNVGEQIPGSATTVAEAFRAAGYLTAAFIRNDFVGPTTHTEQGFDFFFPGDVIGAPASVPGGGGNAVLQAAQRMFRPLLPQGRQGPDAGAGPMNFNSGSSRDLWTKVEPWLEQYKDVPFLLYMHAVDPHEPYEPEKADRAKFLSSEDETSLAAMDQKLSAWQQQQQQFVANFGGGGFGRLVVTLAAPTPPPVAPTPAAPAAGAGAAGDADAGAGATPDGQTPPLVPPVTAVAIQGGEMASMYAQAGIDAADYMRKQRAIYDAEVHYFDRHYQQVRDYFAANGLTDRTVFSFNADHGEEFLDHGAQGHGQSVYAELNHVPWILSAPGLVPVGKVLPDNVANLDLGPTLLGLVGIVPPDTMQGRNLAEELKSGEDLPASMIVTERWSGGMFGLYGDSAGAEGEGEYLGEWAVIEGRWKTIVRRSMAPAVGIDGKPGAPELTVELEIYDLLADMTDSKSLIETERPRAEESSKRLAIWLGEMRKLNARYAGENTASDGALDMMRALGYAQ
ncbi:MAG: hypothetical protein EXS13_03920 [Planctomycetes bacterium]|nr:hypothetical protein [Planctomycetota bacterium]